jgi:diketogulonate reductase-like aldo/keto reductase
MTLALYTHNINQKHYHHCSCRTSKKKLSDPINQENRTNSYRALEQLYNEGKLKHIGISNYTTKHLSHLLDNCTIIPHVHQFELHPCLYQSDLVDLCQKNNIQIQAYSSLGEGNLINGKIQVDCIEDISERVGVSKALVLLRWAIQHGWIIIPKSKTIDRIKENSQVLSFELSQDVSIVIYYLLKT